MSKNRGQKNHAPGSGSRALCSAPQRISNPGHPNGIITFLTDFGLTDTYVGVMKGVVASINPDARVIDLCHDVAPQDVRGAAFLLANAFGYFPAGTIHVAVVDPTVGSGRAALCVRAGGHYFIGPDNGALSIACYRAGRPEIRLLENDKYFLTPKSRTFHGRDVFAPAAAHLAAGAPIETMGPSARSMKRIRSPRPSVRTGPTLGGRIVYVDRFGNLVTNVGPEDIRRAFPRMKLENLVVTCGGARMIGIVETYADAPAGEALALFGSFNLMEIAVRNGDAASRLGVGRGDGIGIGRGG